MTIYDVIFRLVLEYKMARNHEEYADNKLANFIRSEIPAHQLLSSG